MSTVPAEEPPSLVQVPARGSQSASRAASVLLLLADERRTLSLTEVAQRLGVAKSSTLGVLVSLEASGLIQRSENEYGLAPTVLTLANAYLQSDDIVRHFKRSVPQFTRLRTQIVQLATLVGTDVVFLARHTGRPPLAMTANVADRFPASITAVGTALLARLDDDEVRARYADPARFDRWTDSSVTTVDGLLAKLDRTRAEGFARDLGETNPNVLGLSVALRSSSHPSGDLAVGVSLRPLSVPESEVQQVVAELNGLRDSLESLYVLE